MQIVPLAEYVKLRRQYDSKSTCSWVRNARQNCIPGAFQFNGKGLWYVNLDIHDEEVRKLATQSKTLSNTMDTLALALGLTQEDIAVAMEAARA